MKKVSDVITFINLTFQIVYLVFGRFTTTKLEKLNWIFYIFRPEYMVISGLIALLNTIILICILIASRKQILYTIIIILLNIEFLAYYIRLISMQ